MRTPWITLVVIALVMVNSTVTSLINSVEIFAGGLIAALAGVKRMPFYEETEAAARQPVDANGFLK